MACVQFSLLGISAIIQHGNSLTLEEFSRWYTPAHVLGGWRWKTRRAPENALLSPVRDDADAPVRAHDMDDASTLQPAEEEPEPLPSPIVQAPAAAAPMQGKPQQLSSF